MSYCRWWFWYFVGVAMMPFDTVMFVTILALRRLERSLSFAYAKRAVWYIRKFNDAEAAGGEG